MKCLQSIIEIANNKLDTVINVKDSIPSKQKKPIKNKALWLNLDSLTNFHDVEWHWVKAHNGNPDFQIGYIALRKDGKEGAACLKWSFDYALAKNGKNKLYTIKGMLE